MQPLEEMAECPPRSSWPGKGRPVGEPEAHDRRADRLGDLDALEAMIQL
jgi:hypothetical protein